MIEEISRRKRILFWIVGSVIGFLLGAFLVFQVLFLYRVLPHGGL